MDTPTIDNMNEAIAIFDGWEKKTPREFVKEDYLRYVWEFKYHKSWDKLMPIIKMIREMHTDLLLTIKGGVSGYIKAAGEMNRGLISSDIGKAYQGIYNFLQWYNKQKDNE